MVLLGKVKRICLLFIVLFLFQIVCRAQNKDSATYQKYYSLIQEKAYQTSLTRNIYDWVFISPNKISPSDSLQIYQSDLPFLIFSGKKIRNIKLQKINTFGTIIADTSEKINSKVASIGNSLQVKTMNYIIMQNLLFKKNDTINPYIIADNERILRALPYIEDAKIYIIPVKDDPALVDILVVTQDVWSFAFDAKFFGISRSKFSIYDVNLLGQGHYFKNNISYNTYSKHLFTYEEAFYKIENVSGSFLSTYLRYLHIGKTQRYIFDVSKKFKTPQTKYAGGINFSRNTDTVWINSSGSTWNLRYLCPIKYDSLNIWTGKSFQLNSGRVFKYRPHIIFAARYIRKYYLEQPNTQPNNNIYYLDETYLLGSIVFANNNFITSNLIFNYGKTEDIPYGSLVNITIGKNITMNNSRIYNGIKIAQADFLKKFGYYYVSASCGAEYSENKFQNSIGNLDVNYFSNLLSTGKTNFKYRNFITINYITALSNLTFGKVKFTDESGIRGMKNTGINGTQRLTINLETMLFTPIQIAEFRFSFLGFTDLGWIGSRDKFIFSQKMFSGLGIGMKIRNENLVFKTLQFRIAYYPKSSANNGNSVFSIYTGDAIKFHDFETNGPEILRYE